MPSDFLAWWTRDLRVSAWVFMSCTLLNVFFLCVGLAVKNMTAATPPGQIDVGELWFWLFAFPVMVAWQWKSDLPDWTPIVMVALNPWLYGLMGWCAWRMVKLVRGKPEPDAE